jgi:O-antigen/teichoic acid export membrane protein
MAVAVLIGFQVSATTAMGATIVATWIASIGQLLALNRNLKKELPAGPSTTSPFKWIVIALPIFLVEGFYNLLTNVDILMVGHFMPPENTGVYFATVKTLALVHFVYFAVKAGAAHRFAQYKVSGEQLRYASFVHDTLRWTFWPSVAMCAFILIAGKFLLMMFGSSFVEGYPLLFILVIGLVARASVGPAESVLTMSGEQNMCAVVYAITLMVNIALNLVLIPIYGLTGAAIATTLALVFESFALYATTRRRLGIHMFIVPIKELNQPDSGEQ